jgi:signal peptidase I
MQTGDLPVVAGDTIWIDRTAFALRAPRRWELVVFHCPHDASQLCVKRIVGLPGERIGFRNGQVLIHDRPVPQPVGVEYNIRPVDGVGQAGFDPGQQCWQLGEGCFVVGDNEAISLDSRNWPSGPDLPPKLLVGRPIGRFSVRVEPLNPSVP